MANPNFRGGGYGELVSGIQEDASKRILAASPAIRSGPPFTGPMPPELACPDPEALARIRNSKLTAGWIPDQPPVNKVEMLHR